MGGIIRFAAIMGPLSSLFDFATFAGLVFFFHAAPDEFRTTWFLESMATQILVIFVIRTNARPWQDLPHPALVASSLIALVVAMGLPFTPLGHFFGFQTLSPAVLGAIAVLAVVYLLAAEALKRGASPQHGAGRARRPEISSGKIRSEHRNDKVIRS